MKINECEKDCECNTCLKSKIYDLQEDLSTTQNQVMSLENELKRLKK